MIRYWKGVSACFFAFHSKAYSVGEDKVGKLMAWWMRQLVKEVGAIKIEIKIVHDQGIVNILIA